MIQVFLWQRSNMKLNHGQALHFRHFRAQKNSNKIYHIFLEIFTEYFQNLLRIFINFYLNFTKISSYLSKNYSKFQWKFLKIFK